MASKAKKTARTYKEVAAHFGVSAGTVQKDWRLSGMPGSPGNFDLAAIAEWKQQRGKDPDNPEALLKRETEAALLRRRREAEVRCKQAEAEKRELDNLVRRNQVLPKHEVVRLFSELILASRKRLMQLPDRLMPRFPRDQRHELTDEVRRQVELILREMSDWKPSE